ASLRAFIWRRCLSRVALAPVQPTGLTGALARHYHVAPVSRRVQQHGLGKIAVGVEHREGLAGSEVLRDWVEQQGCPKVDARTAHSAPRDSLVLHSSVRDGTWIGRRWPALTPPLQPSLPAVASSRPCGGSLSQDCSAKCSPPSSKPPSSTKNSPPSGTSSATEVFGAQRSIRTCSRLSLNSRAISTSGLPGAYVYARARASRRTGVRSCKSTCHSLTKSTQPGAEPGVWREVGGLRT